MKRLKVKKEKAVKRILCAAGITLFAATPISAAVLSNIGGEVERIIVDDPTDTWSRGTIVVAGRNIIIPRNNGA